MSLKSAAQIINGMGYREQISSDEWAEFSRRIRSQRGNTCEICRLGDRATQVHHVFYDMDRKLTEYSGQELMVLCVECHKQVHEQLKLFRKLIFHHMTPQSFRALNAGLLAGVVKNDSLELAYAITELANDPRAVKNFCNAWIARKPVPPLVPPTV